MSISTLELLDIEVTSDEGQYVWAATCTLGDYQQIKSFPFNKPFQVSFGGELYSLVVDSRSIDRSNPQDPRAVVYGVSPIVKYAFPRARKISKTWEAVTQASDIALELIPELVWEVIDWPVPASTFGVQATSPLSAVQQLAAAVGAIVESLPDGSIHVRYKHPTSVPEYGPATKAFTLDDLIDNFSYSEKYQPNKLVNMLVLSDQQTSGGSRDTVEFVPDEGDVLNGVLRIYPSVWRETISVHATAAVAGLTHQGIKTRTETETVEFVAGAASVRFPVVSITGTVWKDVDLGALSFQSYDRPLRSAASEGAYSQAEISYQTQWHEYRVSGYLGTQVQFVVEDV